MALSATAPYKPSGGLLQDFSIATGVTVYQGALVALNAGGYVILATDTSGSIFLGVATETKDNSSGDNGALDVQVDIGGAAVLVTHTGGSLTIANVGDAAYADGDDAVDTLANATNPMLVGVITNVPSATTCWVKCRPFGGSGAGADITQTSSAITEGGTDIGGTQTGNITALAVSWDGSAAFPTAAEGALLIDGIRENAAMINALVVDVAALIAANNTKQ